MSNFIALRTIINGANTRTIRMSSMIGAYGGITNMM